MPTNVTSHKGVIIAATSDLHGCLDDIVSTCDKSKADILIVAGDIQPADPYYHFDPMACRQWFLNEFFYRIGLMKCEVVVIPGNHDFWFCSWMRGEYGKMDEFKNKYQIPKNFHLLSDKEITLKGLRIYGMPWVPWINGRWCYELFDEDLRDKCKKIPEGIDILVTHTPPRYNDAKIDVSLEYDPHGVRHFGDTNLTSAIFRTSPAAVVCGHIHSGDHNPYIVDNQSGDSKTHIFNVSRVNERYEVEYPIKIFTINGRSVKDR